MTSMDLLDEIIASVAGAKEPVKRHVAERPVCDLNELGGAVGRFACQTLAPT